MEGAEPSLSPLMGRGRALSHQRCSPRIGAQHGGMDVTSGWRMGAAELPQIKRQKVGAMDLEVVSALKKKNGLGTAGAHV